MNIVKMENSKSISKHIGASRSKTPENNFRQNILEELLLMNIVNMKNSKLILKPLGVGEKIIQKNQTII